MTATVTRIHPEHTAPHGWVTTTALLEAGISWRHIDYWCHTGRIKATVINGTRYYPPQEVQVATYTRRLTAAGVQLNTALDAARALVEGKTVTLADGLITIRDTP